MYRILIACEDEQIAIGIQRALNEAFAVECGGTAAWTLNLVSSFRPDMIVVSTSLPDMDAFTLVRTLRAAGECCGILLLTDLINETVKMQARTLGVNSLYLKPCKPNYLASQIYELVLLQKNLERRNWNLEDAVSISLSDLGFRPGSERYRCIRQAILTKYAGNDDMMMKSVYLEVAKQRRGTPEQVEKAVRDAIKAAWQEDITGIWNACFRQRRNKKPGPPTNEEFVAKIVDSLRRQKRLNSAVLMDRIG